MLFSRRTTPSARRTAAPRLALAVVLSLLGTAACGRSAAAPGSAPKQLAAVQHFRSRPDLTPPVLTVTQQTPTPAGEGLFFLAPKEDVVSSGPLIVDAAGHVVWFDPKAPRATDFRVQTYRGQPVLTFWQGVDYGPRGFGDGEFVMLDSSYREIARIRAGNGYSGDLHEFRLTDDGHALVVAYDEVPYDLTEVGGPKDGWLLNGVAQEVDVATGQVVFSWSALDHVALSESSIPITGLGTKAMPWDFFHINSAALDGGDALLVSARNTQTVYDVARATGDVRWRLGGKRSDFAMGEGTAFAWQHDAQRQPDGTITIFDNESFPDVGPQSRAIVLRLDRASMTATLAQQYVSPHHPLAQNQGNVQVLDDGNVVVGWGQQPWFTEFTADGQVLEEATFSDGANANSYRVYRMPWTATPTSPPDIAATRSGGQMTVASSWNGATDVAAWEVITGPDADHLTRAALVTKDGFETTTTVPSAGAVAVRALDRSGVAVGTSRIVLPSGR